MDPSSEEEILPSPLTSNLLKTCLSSSSMLARELREEEREMAGDGSREGVVERETLRFFFLLNRDRKLMDFGMIVVYWVLNSIELNDQCNNNTERF